jgi:hypothetical protein
MANVARLTPLEIAALSEYLSGGGSLLVFLGSRVDAGDYNRNLLPRLALATGASSGAAGSPVSISIEAVALGGEGADGGRGFFTIERLDRGHAVFAKFKGDQSPFGEARFYAFMKVTGEGGRVVARFSDGSPALVEVGDGAMVFTSAADGSWSDLVLTPQFLPIMHEALLYLTSGARIGQAYGIGDEVAVKSDGSDEAYLEGPTGKLRLFPEAIGGGTGYRIPAPAQPGVYFLVDDAETLSVFAANLDARESDLTKAQPREVEADLAGFEIKWVTTPDDVGESVSLLRRGRDLSRTLLWAGLALLLAETLLASTFSLRRAGADDHDALSDN